MPAKASPKPPAADFDAAAFEARLDRLPEEFWPWLIDLLAEVAQIKAQKAQQQTSQEKAA